MQCPLSDPWIQSLEDKSLVLLEEADLEVIFTLLDLRDTIHGSWYLELRWSLFSHESCEEISQLDWPKHENIRINRNIKS